LPKENNQKGKTAKKSQKRLPPPLSAKATPKKDLKKILKGKAEEDSKNKKEKEDMNKLWGNLFAEEEG